MNALAWLLGFKAAPNYTARAGQVIAGNLARGGDGKFTSASSGGSDSKPAVKPKPVLRPAPTKPAAQAGPAAKKPKKTAKPKKPKRTRAQYDAERAARKKARLAKIAAQRAAKKRLPKKTAKPAKSAAATANQKKVMQQTLAGGIGPKSFGVMNAIRDGKKPDAKTLAVLSKSGLVTADGKLTTSSPTSPTTVKSTV